MAELRIHHSGEVLTDPAAIQAFVQANGQLAYQRWDIARLHGSGGELQDGESEQERVLRVFSKEVSAISEEGGYVTADVIALTPETPNLETMLARFDREHLHTEDEVRFVVDGRGVFTIHTVEDVVYDVEVHPGDLLVVPTDTWHWFTLCEDRQIKCIRIFQSKDGWTPHYREEPSAAQ